MTNKERKSIKQAIDYFLSDDPDKWTDGIDEIYLLIYGEKWSDVCGLNNIKPVKIYELMKKD